MSHIPKCPKCHISLIYDPDLSGPSAINAPRWVCTQCGYTEEPDFEEMSKHDF